MFMYMCDNRLSDHTNADLCIDGKSGVSRDISCLTHSVVHRIRKLPLAAVQKKTSLLSIRLHQYFKNTANS